MKTEPGNEMNYLEKNCAQSQLEFNLNGRVYLPAAGVNGLTQQEGLRRYLETEFPERDATTTIYSVPRTFTQRIELQASRAEQTIFDRFAQLSQIRFKGLWMLYFHGASYAGHSYRNQRVGKLMIREHDFVVFTKYQGRCFVTLVEVKSTHDSTTKCPNVMVTSDARVVKNNKRSAQHQLRDHLEVLGHCFMDGSCLQLQLQLQACIMWPFLGGWTKDPKQCLIRRWKEDGDLHVFEDVLRSQDKFEEWFEAFVLNGKAISEEGFQKLLNRYYRTYRHNAEM